MSIPTLSEFNYKLIPIAQRSIAAGSVGASYSLIGTVFNTSVVLLTVVSTLDQAVQLSWDGAVDHLPMPAGGTLVLDFKTNGAVFPGFYGVYVKRIKL